MSSDLTLSSSQLVDLVFSDSGPRGPWQEDFDGSMSKVLAAGLSVHYQKIFDHFLTELNLPKTQFIEQPEFEDNIKRYVILSIPRSDWEKNIEQATQSGEKMAEIRSKAKTAIDQWVSSQSFGSHGLQKQVTCYPVL